MQLQYIVIHNAFLYDVIVIIVVYKNGILYLIKLHYVSDLIDTQNY